jgi:heme-degrading monooxygenase HmoA
MYARYTEFQFDARDRDAVLRFWETVALPSASRQPGWQAAYVLESDESEGVLRTFTLWDEPADFHRYRSSEEHAALGEGIRSSGLRIVVRDGLESRFMATSAGPLLRVTRARFDPARVADAAAYWRDAGGPMMRRAQGCRRAEGYWAGDGSEFVLVAEWASREAADAFLAGPDHRAFGAAMDELGSTVFDRIVGDHVG